jgi:hypothetical protein
LEGIVDEEFLDSEASFFARSMKTAKRSQSGTLNRHKRSSQLQLRDSALDFLIGRSGTKKSYQLHTVERWLFSPQIRSSIITTSCYGSAKGNMASKTGFWASKA